MTTSIFAGVAVSRCGRLEMRTQKTFVNGITERYSAPDSNAINDFSRAACQHFAQDDPHFSDPQVVAGLAAFLAIVAEIIAKHLNEHGDEFLDTFHTER